MTLDQKKAIIVIRNYLNVDDNSIFTNDYIMKNYGMAVDMIIEQANEIKSLKAIGIKSKSEGNQSITYADGVESWKITDSIKAFLPTPFVKMYY
ncbi:TPA: hypothetical protein PTV68_002048 [Clostridium botulinum]|nr:hypothetical protein [Clostridium botulinum]HDK7188712.1 hypothetical protein [Clostridium botulinum]HDK7215631.1 hypothetical protein [Clostridium botulinum]HDK7231385.1 hypothetical protein [Clostridium botulinum]HDK7260743.1 hypothetical protein [Clostridium botulinum]